MPKINEHPRMDAIAAHERKQAREAAADVWAAIKALYPEIADTEVTPEIWIHDSLLKARNDAAKWSSVPFHIRRRRAAEQEIQP